MATISYTDGNETFETTPVELEALDEHTTADVWSQVHHGTSLHDTISCIKYVVPVFVIDGLFGARRRRALLDARRTDPADDDTAWSLDEGAAWGPSYKDDERDVPSETKYTVAKGMPGTREIAVLDYPRRGTIKPGDYLALVVGTEPTALTVPGKRDDHDRIVIGHVETIEAVYQVTATAERYVLARQVNRGGFSDLLPANPEPGRRLVKIDESLMTHRTITV